MTVVAQSRPFVIGVDTHAKTHTYAVVETASGQLLGCQQFPTTPPGIARAITWAARLTRGEADTLWSVEGVATYGARLARAAAESGYEVVEAPRISARTRHGVGKSDPLDAHAIATAVLPVEEDRLRRPRADDGTRQALRVLVAARDQMATEKTVNINALTALLRANDLGVDTRKPLTAAQIGQMSRWQKRSGSRNDAAFASLAGVNPLPASSGNTTRHRLNRGGDRRLNKALHFIAITRMSRHPGTKAYLERRLAGGRTRREIRRCIKRYLARHLYRTLNALYDSSSQKAPASGFTLAPTTG